MLKCVEISELGAPLLRRYNYLYVYLASRIVVMVNFSL